MGAQKNRLIETVLLSTHNICFGWEIRKLNFRYALLTKVMPSYSLLGITWLWDRKSVLRDQHLSPWQAEWCQTVITRDWIFYTTPHTHDGFLYSNTPAHHSENNILLLVLWMAWMVQNAAVEVVVLWVGILEMAGHHKDVCFLDHHDATEKYENLIHAEWLNVKVPPCYIML